MPTPFALTCLVVSLAPPAFAVTSPVAAQAQPADVAAPSQGAVPTWDPTAQELAAPQPITAPREVVEPLPIGAGHGGVAAPNSPIILFVNMDGATLRGNCGNDARNDCSTLRNLFGGAILPYSGDQSDRAALMQSVRSKVVDFGVIAVNERPPANQPYSMVLLGNGASGDQSFAGVAPYIDCGNSDPWITSFSLDIGGINTKTAIIHQEAAHTWGLEHVNATNDLLHPTTEGSNKQYQDTCYKIVADTDLNPTNGQCNSIHTRYCQQGFQNSYQEMLYLFGPPIADTTAPTVAIDAPADGAEVPVPVNFPLTITIDDDRRPAVLDLVISLDGAPAITGKYANSTVTFPVSGGISEGPHTFRVEITDESGNPAAAEVNFTVVGAGGGSGTTGDPTTTGGTTDDSSGTTDASSTTTGASSSGSTSDDTATTATSATTAPATTSTTGSPATTGGETDGLPGTDSGAGADADEGGCACSTDAQGRGPTGSLWLLGAGVLLALGRRRRAA
jgi:MYXO-CTERM domain-containing protein